MLSGIPPDRMHDVSCMKFLEKWGSLTALVVFVHAVPSDCLFTLLSAGLQRRSFVLELCACHSQVQLIADQWQVSQRIYPDVCLKVHM